MQPPVPLTDIEAAVAKTGFRLEYEVAEAFRSSGWSCITNRYYADDTDGRARELDLIAFRVRKTEHVDVVTTVLISCKKDSENTWAFLSRNWAPQDPNIDWAQHIWTDLEPLDTYLKSVKWKADYVKADKRARDFTFDVKRDVFAFQQISPPGVQQKAVKSGSNPPPARAAAAKNDTAIFNSLTGLFKALVFELEALKERVPNQKRLYVFTLAVIAEAPLVDVQHNGQEIHAVVVDKLLHSARYMVGKQHVNALVHFIRSDQLSWFISEMGHLHEINSRWWASQVPASYNAILTNTSIREHFEPRIEKRLIWRINLFLREKGLSDRLEDFGLDVAAGGLRLSVDADKVTLDLLNTDPQIQDLTTRVLRDVARYKGKFAFSDLIPF